MIVPSLQRAEAPALLQTPVYQVFVTYIQVRKYIANLLSCDHNTTYPIVDYFLLESLQP